MTPSSNVTTTAPVQQESKLSSILQAILAGFQIAAQALPLILQYKDAFGTHPHTLVNQINMAMNNEHPVTKAIVAAALTQEK